MRSLLYSAAIYQNHQIYDSENVRMRFPEFVLPYLEYHIFEV
jgi:hypothetical protein